MYVLVEGVIEMGCDVIVCCLLYSVYSVFHFHCITVLYCGLQANFERDEVALQKRVDALIMTIASFEQTVKLKSGLKVCVWEREGAGSWVRLE